MAGDDSPVNKPAAGGSQSPTRSPSSKGSPPAKGSPSPTKSQSPKVSQSVSPGEGSPQAPLVSGILPAQHWIETAQEHDADDSDATSIAESMAKSTASLTSSILKYRSIHGRTYHSEIGNASYWASNDSQQNDSMDIAHHLLTLLLGGKLFLAPLETDKIQDVLDIGTGTGSWAIDFADEHPNTQVIGTDISPIQPGWVPPNLKFELEDCTLDWTYRPESMDYIHMRWLVGSIGDWDTLFAQAYRALRPGGWVESFETSPRLYSDDDTVPENSAMSQWSKIFFNFGKTIGRPFTVVDDDIQENGMRAAGFVDVGVSERKTPLGSWPKDMEQKEIGDYAHVALEADIEGYMLYPATGLGWSPQEVTVFAAHFRRELRSPQTHPYYRQKVVWGRKPMDA